jgi:hypothetical protein
MGRLLGLLVHLDYAHCVLWPDQDRVVTEGLSLAHYLGANVLWSGTEVAEGCAPPFA